MQVYALWNSLTGFSSKDARTRLVAHLHRASTASFVLTIVFALKFPGPSIQLCQRGRSLL
jgi:hypothetical protein